MGKESFLKKGEKAKWNKKTEPKSGKKEVKKQKKKETSTVSEIAISRDVEDMIIAMNEINEDISLKSNEEYNFSDDDNIDDHDVDDDDIVYDNDGSVELSDDESENSCAETNKIPQIDASLDKNEIEDTLSDSNDSNSISVQSNFSDLKKLVLVSDRTVNRMKRDDSIRKLIRDDRRLSRLADTNGSEDLCAIVKRMKKSINIINSQETSVSNSLKIQPASTRSNNNNILNSNDSVKSINVSNNSLRINLQCDKKPGSKLVIVNRDVSLNEIIGIGRTKFAVNNKYNALKVSSDNNDNNIKGNKSYRFLTSIDVSSLLDDVVVILCINQESSSLNESVVNEVNNKQIDKKDEVINGENNSKKKIDTVEIVNKQEYWLPPINQSNNEVQLQSDFNIIRDDPILSQELKRKMNELTFSVHIHFNQYIYIYMSLKILNQENYSSILKSRSTLPIFERKREIISAISSNKVVVVAGETGHIFANYLFEMI